MIVLSVDDPDDMATWHTFWNKIWGRASLPEPPARDGAEALAYLKRTTRDWPAVWQAQVDGTPDDDTENVTCFIDEMKYWVPVPFPGSGGGRVTLAGDAAHPMLIYRGQGLQHAIVDAVNYVDALVRIRDGQHGDDSDKIMEAYGAEVVERGAKAVTQSVQEATLAMDLESVGKMMMARQGHGKSA